MGEEFDVRTRVQEVYTHLLEENRVLKCVWCDYSMAELRLWHTEAQYSFQISPMDESIL